MRALFTDQESIEVETGNFIPYIFAHIWKDKMIVIGIGDVIDDVRVEWLTPRQKELLNTCDVIMSASKYLEYTCKVCRNKGGSKKLTFLPWVSHCRESDINGLFRLDQRYNSGSPFFKRHPIIDPCGCNPLWNGIPQVCSMKVIQNLAPNFFNLPYIDDSQSSVVFTPLPSEIGTQGPITKKQYRYIVDLEKAKKVRPTMNNLLLHKFTTAQASHYIRYLTNLNGGPSTLQSLMRRIDQGHIQTHDPLDDAEDLVTVLEEAMTMDDFEIPTTNYI
jgi:hypothetical protein